MLPINYNYFLNFSVGDLSCQLLRVIYDTFNTSGDPTNYFTHKHPFVEMHYVSQGHCTYATEDALYEIRPNHLLIIPPNTDHVLNRVSVPRRHMFLSIHIQPPSDQANNPSLALYHALHTSAPILLEVPQKSMLAEALHHIGLLADENKQILSVQEAMRSYSNLLMAGLSEILVEAPTLAASPTQISAPQSFLIDQFFCYPSAMNGGAEVLAKMLKVSLRQLDRILLDTYGMNFRKKLNQTKLNYATDLLSNKDLSIDQIARLLGYSNSSSFGAFIKKATGKTPIELRKNL